MIRKTTTLSLLSLATFVVAQEDSIVD